MFESIIENLEKRNIAAMEVKTAQEAVEELKKLIPEKSSIGFGGSRTLESLEFLDVLRNWDYTLFDRTQFQKGSPEARQMMLDWQHADFFLSSCNAITEDGQLIFWETNGNRISSIIYGPSKIILIVGKNKIVKTVEEWLARTQFVAEQIAKRLEKTVEEIWCYKVIVERQWSKERLSIIFVDEDLGT